MTRAQQILRTAHTAGQVSREAMRWCAGSIHSKSRNEYRFADGSSITISGNAVSVGG